MNTEEPDHQNSLNFYELLGVDKHSSIEQIQTEFRLRSIHFHPDKTDDESSHRKFKELSYAKSVLCDSEKRKAYDSWVANGKEIMSFPDWLRNFNQLKSSFHFVPVDTSRRLESSTSATNESRSQKQAPNVSSVKKATNLTEKNAKTLYDKFKNYEL